MKVLIVDDEKIIRRGMVSNIPWRKLGLLEPLEARNGQEALKLFERERPEILLTDIRMPLMDGIELTNKVRELSRDVKIIYMSGFQDIKYIRAAFENSAVDYILKPVEYQELLRTLEKAARMYREDAELRRQLAELPQGTRAAPPPVPESPADRIAAEIRGILDCDLSKNITIRELSRRVFLTPQYLCTVFKQRTGMTINDYVTGRRIERAKELLRSGQYKLYEIAPMVGYQDTKYFSRVFKRLTGMTPSDYQ